MNFSTISIHGVPRSGTSWLGQIFDSHPNVAYRHQPLFAYRFKDRLNLQSTQSEIYRFLQELYLVNDDFILDTSRRKPAESFWQKARKLHNPRFLVMKMVRYHHLLSLFLENIEDLKLIGVIRHPCAVINSWLQAPKEFRSEWNIYEEWRYAPKKNADRIEEFNGFEKWKTVAYMFLEFEHLYPNKFTIVQYERLVKNTDFEVSRLFSFVGLEMHPQTLEFIQLSHNQHDSDPYSVFKDGSKHNRWHTELSPAIAQEILHEVRYTPLERFLI